MLTRCRRKKKLKETLSIWKPSFDKYLKIFIREYHISREEALLEYSWDDIQNFVTDLPAERVITVYDSKKAENKERYLLALCDRDVDGAFKALDSAEAEFMARKEALKKKE
jgi:hypothetical protein